MNRVLFISLKGESSRFEHSSLDACVNEANRLNTERGFGSGVHVVERDDGHRMTAHDCKAHRVAEAAQ